MRVKIVNFEVKVINILKFCRESFTDHPLFLELLLFIVGPVTWAESLLGWQCAWVDPCPPHFFNNLDTFSQRTMKLSELIKLISTWKQAHKVAQLVVQHRDNTGVAGTAWGALEFGAYRIYNLPALGKLFGTRAPTKQGQASPPTTLPTQTHQATVEEDCVHQHMQMEQTWLGRFGVPAPFMDFLMSQTIQSHSRL